MDRCAVFVDAGYLHESAKTLMLGGHPGATVRANAVALVREITALAVAQTELPLLRIYWYAAAPNRNPYPDQRELASLGNIKLRLGNLRERAGGRMVQKGVDAELHADMTGLARNRGAVDFVLLTGDEDLLRAVDEVQSYGVRVHLWGVEAGPDGGNQSLELIAAADRRHVLEEAWIRRVFTILEPPKPDSPTARPVEVTRQPDGTLRSVAPRTAQPVAPGADAGNGSGAREAVAGDGAGRAPAAVVRFDPPRTQPEHPEVAVPAAVAAPPGRDAPAPGAPAPAGRPPASPVPADPAALDPAALGPAALGPAPASTPPIPSAPVAAAGASDDSGAGPDRGVAGASAELPATPAPAPTRVADAADATVPVDGTAPADGTPAPFVGGLTVPKPTDLRPRPHVPTRGGGAPGGGDTLLYTTSASHAGFSPTPDYGFYRLSDLTTQAEQYADAAEDATTPFDAISVGRTYARRWLSRATSEAATMLALEHPTIPRAIDAELLRYAVARGVDTWTSETDKFAVRQGFWSVVRLGVPEAPPIEGA